MRRLLFLVILSLIFGSFALAQETSVSEHGNFSGIVATLKELVKRNAKTRRNTFYISGVKKDGSREFAYAYWKQDKSIIILQLPLEKETADYYWLYSKARIDLLTGVVPTEEDIKGSSFLVDRPWVDKILQRCSDGYVLSVRKKPNN